VRSKRKVTEALGICFYSIYAKEHVNGNNQADRKEREFGQRLFWFGQI